MELVQEKYAQWWSSEDDYAREFMVIVTATAQKRNSQETLSSTFSINVLHLR
jgi:hypothetical protein